MSNYPVFPFHESLRKRLVRYRHILKHFVVYGLIRRSWRKHTRRMRNRYEGQTAFIFATGPSVNRLDLEKIEKEKAAGAKIFGVNSYVSSSLADRLSADFIVVSDPFYVKPLSDELKKYEFEVHRDMGAIEAKKGFQLCVPHLWYDEMQAKGSMGGKEIVYFNHSENIKGRPNGCDLLRPRYYVAMTAYMALSVALYLGFRKIYLCGFDEDYIAGAEVDQRNHLIWRDRHFYAESEERVFRDMTVEAGLSLQSFCANLMNCIYSQEKIQLDAERLGAEVLNTNPASYVTGFKKTAEFLL